MSLALSSGSRRNRLDLPPRLIASAALAPAVVRGVVPLLCCSLCVSAPCFALLLHTTPRWPILLSPVLRRSRRSVRRRTEQRTQASDLHHTAMTASPKQQQSRAITRSGRTSGTPLHTINASAAAPALRPQRAQGHWRAPRPTVAGRTQHRRRNARPLAQQRAYAGQRMTNSNGHIEQDERRR